MKKLYITIIALLIFPTFSFSQESTDSKSLEELYDSLFQYERQGNLADGIRFGYQLLLQTKEENNEKLEGRALLTLAKLLNYQGQEDSSKVLAKELVLFSERKAQHNSVINSSNLIALIYFNQSLYDSSEVYYQIAMRTAKKFVPNRYPTTLANLAFINGYMGQDEVEMGYYFKAIEAIEMNPSFDERGGVRAMAYGGIGDYYLRIGDYETAKENYEAKLSLGLEKENKRMIYEANGGLGTLFSKEGYYDFEESRKNYLAVAKDTSEDYLAYRGSALINIGKLYKGEKEFTQALSYFKEALTLYETTSSIDWQSRVLYQIGDVHFKKGSHIEAESWFKKVLSNSISSKLPLRERDALLGLYKVDSIKNDFRSSLAKYQRYRAIEDSLFTEDSKEKIQELQIKYETGEKDKENLLLKSELNLSEANLEKERLFKTVIIGVAIIMIILAIFYYRNYRKKKEAAQLLEAQNRTILEQKDELAFKSDKLQLVNSQLRAIAEFKTDLTRMVAHDMKNPLNAIIGLSTSNPKDKRAGNITQSGYQLLNLVTNMLEIDKYETTNYIPEVKGVPLDQIILESRRRIEILLEAKAIRFESLIPKMICVNVDEEAIKRVFVNLLSNAIKYSPTEGRVLIDKLKVVEDMIWIKVSDEGAGISEDRLPNIFDKFWQSDAKESGFAMSTGLGLTFCKMTVEAHGGKIWAESEIGKGTSIYITLPIEKDNKCEETLGSSISNSLHVEEPMIIEKESELLKRHAQFLKSLKVHQVSAITRVIQDLEEKQVASKWKTVFQAAVYQGDQEKYDELIDLLLRTKEGAE